MAVGASAHCHPPRQPMPPLSVIVNEAVTLQQCNLMHAEPLVHGRAIKQVHTSWGGGTSHREQRHGQQACQAGWHCWQPGMHDRHAVLLDGRLVMYRDIIRPPPPLKRCGESSRRLAAAGRAPIQPHGAQPGAAVEQRLGISVCEG